MVLAGCSSDDSEATVGSTEVEEETEAGEEESSEIEGEENEGEVSLNLEEADESTPTQAVEVEEISGMQQPVIVEYGYYINEWDELQLGFGIKNPSTDYAIEHVEIEITGKDDGGSIIFTDTDNLSGLRPCETQYLGYENTSVEGTTAVEVKALTVEDRYFAVSDAQVDEYFTLENTSAIADEYGGYNFTGEMTVNDAASEFTYATLSVILRDEAGVIVYGDATLERLGAVGETTAFELGIDWDLPMCATYELHITPSL